LKDCGQVKVVAAAGAGKAASIAVKLELMTKTPVPPTSEGSQKRNWKVPGVVTGIAAALVGTAYNQAPVVD